MEIAVCPKCKRPLSRANAWHYCETVDIDTLFEDKSDRVVLCFDAIFREVSEWENVAFSATKNCVVFLHRKTFLVIKPMKNWLEVKFFSDSVIEDERLHKQYERGKRYEAVFRFEFEEQVDSRIIQRIRHSHEIS